MVEQDSVYQLRVDLRGAKPPIWRRILVRPDITLHRLHVILQALMGWNGWHLHAFEKDGTYYSTPGLEAPVFMFTLDDKPFVRDESAYQLQDLLNHESNTLNYFYDFGDGWEHIIKLEKVLPAEAGATYPVCVKGKRATPPEDSGGIRNYNHKLLILTNPSHPDYEWVTNLLPPDHDPERFDLNEVNNRLASLDQYEAREERIQSVRLESLSGEEPPPIQLTPFFSNEPNGEDVDIEETRETLLSMLRNLVGEVQEVLSGYRLSFPSDPVVWMLCANLVVLEYTLDPSRAFGIEIEADGGPIWLRVTGRDAKQFVKTAFDL
ncbi:MAG: plasmid pRiA4b ORF-3 family protein [Aggregatilineales bacterium]|nr:plasmid pRiA4b ORF-3 family protein [Chloroflexota bacterium]HOA25004.1 plasmid pRiA4b ORF-3 family protein [Aggregatilineales bacterium]HPV07638.1 plasmid pRiA4b ORF-3 family protein [Aggregatilineales bacterium]HQE18766.1 plasmid pRiA4b ORF-3 family protein [Aggregatilineales bacterium]